MFLCRRRGPNDEASQWLDHMNYGSAKATKKPLQGGFIVLVFAVSL